jgi:hypothetical protein
MRVFYFKSNHHTSTEKENISKHFVISRLLVEAILTNEGFAEIVLHRDYEEARARGNILPAKIHVNRAFCSCPIFSFQPIERRLVD